MFTEDYQVHMYKNVHCMYFVTHTCIIHDCTIYVYLASNWAM